MSGREFQAGVNLGGWISQYRAVNKEHFDTFITEKDIAQIASWGMDHVRLPVDYPVFEDDDHPGEYKEDGLKYIDDCVAWCTKYDLGIIIDLHKAPGYSFGTLESNTLFSDAAPQDRFIKIWEMFARRYRSEDDRLQLELLNEVVEKTSDRWNNLAHRTIAAIREIDPTRKVIFGGNHYNSIDQLKEIQLVENDDNIIYNFHFYKPHMFTHQKASWSPMTRLYNQTVEYPGSFPNLNEFFTNHPEFSRNNDELPEYMDKSLLEAYVQPAVDFIEAHKLPLYCGEYGVIDETPMQSRINWHRDFIDILKDLHIGRACWSYKLMNFALVDRDGNVVSDELVKIVSEK